MKKVYELVIETPSGEVYSHFFSSKKIATEQQSRTRLDWRAFVREHKVFNYSW